MEHGIKQIEKLRNWRGFYEQRDLAGELEKLCEQIGRSLRDEGSAAAAWSKVCPEPLRGRCKVVGVGKGGMKVWVADAGTRYELERFLRAGGLRLLRRSSSVSIQRVRFVLSEPKGSG